MNIAKLWNRIKRVLSLDKSVFLEIREDKEAFIEAFIVVIITSIVFILGAYVMEISPLSNLQEFQLTFGLMDILIIPLLYIIQWLVVTMCLHLPALMLGGTSSYTKYLRATGYALLPYVFVIIPLIGLPIGNIWGVTCQILALKSSQELNWPRTILAFIFGGIFIIIIMVLFGSLFYYFR